MKFTWKKRDPRAAKSRQEDIPLIRIVTIGALLLGLALSVAAVLYVFSVLRGAFEVPATDLGAGGQRQSRLLAPELLERVRAAAESKTAPRADIDPALRDPFTPPPVVVPPAPTPETPVTTETPAEGTPAPTPEE